MPKKPKIDEEKCIGCGTCVALCPKTFKLVDSGKAVVYDEAGDDEAEIQMASDSCPTAAIIVE